MLHFLFSVVNLKHCGAGERALSFWQESRPSTLNSSTTQSLSALACLLCTKIILSYLSYRSLLIYHKMLLFFMCTHQPLSVYTPLIRFCGFCGFWQLLVLLKLFQAKIIVIDLI